ncbi:MAG: hypothetical protein QHC90_21550 [Shinella sp.]|nr:hypothetical protein [Shinella sp.]
MKQREFSFYVRMEPERCWGVSSLDVLRSGGRTVYQIVKRGFLLIFILLQLSFNAAKKCRFHAPRGNDANLRVA